MFQLGRMRRLFATILALTLMLGGASQALASITMLHCAMNMPASEPLSMSATDMDGMSKAPHGTPCTSSDTECALCMALFVAPSFENHLLVVGIPGHKVEISAITGRGRSIPPALPPPITLV